MSRASREAASPQHADDVRRAAIESVLQPRASGLAAQQVA